MPIMASRPTVPVACKNKNGSYWKSFWYDDTGKHRSKSFGNTDKVTEAKASQKYREWLAEWHATPKMQTPGERPLTVRDLVDRYNRFAEAYYQADGVPTGTASNAYYALVPLVELFGDLPPENLRPKHLKAYQATQVKGSATTSRKPASLGVINERTNTVRRMLKWAVGEELIEPAVLLAAQAVPNLKPGRAILIDGEPITPQHSDGVLPVAEDHVQDVIEGATPTLGAMIRLQWLTGMRPGELCNMEVGQIRTNVQVDVSASQQVRVWVYEPGRFKTKHRGLRRRIFFGPEAIVVVEPMLSRRTDGPVFDPITHHHELMEQRIDAYEPPDTAQGDYRKAPSYQRRREQSRQHKPERMLNHWTVASYRQSIGHVITRLNKDRKQPIPSWTPNQLRHAALHRIAESMATEQARVVAGHRDARTTEIYLKLFDRDEREAASVMSMIG